MKKDESVGSPSNGPFVTSCSQNPKIFFFFLKKKKTKEKSHFSQQDLLDNFFSGFGVCSDDRKNELQEKVKRKENGNIFFKEEPNKRKDVTGKMNKWKKRKHGKIK